MIEKKSSNILYIFDDGISLEYQPIFNTPKKLRHIINNFINDSNKKFLIIYGGRGGGKSLTTMQILLEWIITKNYNGKDLIFFRNFKELLGETKNFVKDAILSNTLTKDNFILNDKEYINKNNKNVIKFLGMNDFSDSARTKHKNNSKLKSFNNAGLIFVDEADFITEKQLNILLPTIRHSKIRLLNEDLKNDAGELNINKGAKFIFCLNPNKPNGDDVINVLKERKETTIIKFNYFDLEKEFQDKEILKEIENDNILLEQGLISRESYNHKWLGEPSYEDNMQPFINCSYINIDDLGEYDRCNNGVVYMDCSNGGDYNAVSIVWKEYINTNEYKIAVYGFCERSIGWSDFLENNINFFKFLKSRGFKIFYESNNVGKEPQKLLNKFGILSHAKPTTDNKKLKIQSIYPYLKHFNILQDTYKLNIEYNKQLLSYNNQSKYDDCADCLSMAIRQIINIK